MTRASASWRGRDAEGIAPEAIPRLDYTLTFGRCCIASCTSFSGYA